jgi:hypothetical protein
VNLLDDPLKLWFSVDGLEDAACSVRGDDVVGDTRYLHFRTGETGEVTGDIAFDATSHEEGFRFSFGKEFDVREALEVGILSPEGGAVGESDRGDERVGKGQLVLAEEIGGSGCDNSVNRYNTGGTEASRDGFCLLHGALGEDYFAHLGG